MTEVAAAAHIRSLAWELPYSRSMVKERKKQGGKKGRKEGERKKDRRKDEEVWSETMTEGRKWVGKKWEHLPDQDQPPIW